MESSKLAFRKVVSDWLTGDLPDARKRDINMFNAYTDRVSYFVCL